MALFLDLLDPQEEDVFRRDPSEIETRIAALPASVSCIAVLVAATGSL
jgi:hypothetical protein